MKPISIFVFLIIIAVSIVALSLVLPSGEVELVHGVRLRMFSYKELLGSNSESLVELDRIIDCFSSDFKVDSLQSKKNYEGLKKEGVESFTKQFSQESPDSIGPLVIDEKIFKSQSVPCILFPENNIECLDGFFKSLDNSSSNSENARILFIGDSQIEGDHISGTFRENLQNKFSGEGIGLMHVKEIFNRKYGLHQKVSDNWREYSISYNKDEEDNKFGVTGTYSKLNCKEGEITDGWIKFRRFRTDSLTRNNYRILNLYYSNPGDEAAFVDVLWKGKVIKKKELLPGEELMTLKYGFNFSPNEISLHFKANNKLRLYGLSLECDKGIIVDNLPHRGCATPQLRKTDLQFYKSMLEKMKVKMVILQFGANVVPYAGSKPVFYENRLYKDLLNLRNIAPDIPILIVGVSDLSKKNGTKMESWPNIQAVKKAQIRASQKAGCAFWDLEAAMGGYNSMVSWVNSSPQLGKKDYIHFTNDGAEKIGDMLSNVILTEYQNYQERKMLNASKQLAQK